MSTTFYTTTTIVSGFIPVNNYIQVFSGVMVGSTDSWTFQTNFNNAKYTIDGQVGSSEIGIYTPQEFSGTDILVGASGTVTGHLLDGILLYGSNHSIDNFGEIRGGPYGITISTTGSASSSLILNHGIIRGDVAGITRDYDFTTEKLIIKNFGTITGHDFSFNHDKSLSSQIPNAVEEITNNGLMVGDVSLGLGNDLYDGRKGTIDGDVLGGDGEDKLIGGAGDEHLDGGAGDDVLMGGAGDDDHIGGTGTDRVSYWSASSGVTANLANASVNTGDADGDSYSSIENLSGSRFNDKLTGTSGNNVIDGDRGADRMEGGAGHDRYYVDNAGDVVIEANVSGNDIVVSTVSFSLAGQYIERLTLEGSADIDGTGNSVANEIIGNAGSNILDGSTGNDTLTGGAGGDFFVFSTALGASNVDTITDFNVAADTIRIDNAVFAGLATGTLASDAFAANTTGNAGDATDRIIYETDTGNLYFDADGTGAGAKVLFAKLDPGLALTNADFVVI
jgi:Ca2+-binding RTX toxin-like protein